MNKFLMSALVTLMLSACATQIGTRYTSVGHAPVAPRDIFVALDGTGNNQLSRTNVSRLYEIIDNRSRPNLSTYYAEGVGTDFRLVGAATGLGIGDDVRQAYLFLAEEWNPGDRIFLTGFSRGAYTARILSGMIAIAGIPEVGHLSKGERKRLVKSIYVAYKTKQRKDEDIFDQNERRQDRLQKIDSYVPKAEGRDVPIEAMFLWDTVAALGWPDRTDHPTERLTQYFISNCNVKSVFHAQSLDDNRAYSFTPISVTVPQMTEACPEWKPRVEEVWFSGAHADVGGSYAPGNRMDGFLPGVSMNWMLSRMAELKLVDKSLKLHADPFGPIHDAKAYTLAYKFLGLRYRRPYEYASNSPKHHNGKPVIHKSAIERLKVVHALDGEFDHCDGTPAKVLLLCASYIAKMPFIKNGLLSSFDEKNWKCFIEELSAGKVEGYRLDKDYDCLDVVDDNHTEPLASGESPFISISQKQIVEPDISSFLGQAGIASLESERAN